MSAQKSGVGLVAYSGGLTVDRFHVFGTVLVCAVLALTLLGSETYMRRAPARAGAFCARLRVRAAAAVMRPAAGGMPLRQAGRARRYQILMALPS